MKNIRIEHTSPHLYLASKRSSLNQDKLPQPYKIEWAPNSLQSNDIRSNSNKNFFQNMKDELSNIKQDFQKLIKKQNSYTSASKPGKEENLHSTGFALGSGMKGKSLSSYKKDSKKYVKEPLEETDKLQFLMNHQEMHENYKNKLYSIEKLQPQSDKKNIGKGFATADRQYNTSNPLSKIHSRLLQDRDQQHSEAISKLHSPLPDTKKYQEQLQNTKDRLVQMTAQLSAYKQRSQVLKAEAQSAKSQQTIFKTKLTELSEQLQKKMEYVEAQENKIRQLTQRISHQEHFMRESSQMRNEIQKQRAFFNDRINELVFHNENFHNINGELGRENETLRANLENLHHYVDQLKIINENSENDHKRQLQFMKKDIDQYKKRQNMYEKEIENLTAQLKAKNNENIDIQSSCSKQVFSQIERDQLLHQIQRLKMELENNKNQILLQQKINASLTVKYEQEIKKMNIKSFAESLEKTINELTEQNARLKSKINTMEADLDSLKEQNRSYLKQIILYEDRQKENSTKKQISSNEWQQLSEQIEKLKEENSKLQEQLQFNHVKVEVDKQNTVGMSWQNDKLLKMSHSQLQEIERLKEAVKGLKDENEFLRRQLERQGQICVNLKRQNKELGGLSKPQDQKHCCYIKQMELIDQKNVQINVLKRLIFKVMVQKIGKGENETDSEFWLRKLQQLKPLLSSQ